MTKLHNFIKKYKHRNLVFKNRNQRYDEPPSTLFLQTDYNQEKGDCQSFCFFFSFFVQTNQKFLGRFAHSMKKYAFYVIKIAVEHAELCGCPVLRQPSAANMKICTKIPHFPFINVVTACYKTHLYSYCNISGALPCRAQRKNSIIDVLLPAINICAAGYNIHVL